MIRKICWNSLLRRRSKSRSLVLLFPSGNNRAAFHIQSSNRIIDRNSFYETISLEPVKGTESIINRNEMSCPCRYFSAKPKTVFSSNAELVEKTRSENIRIMSNLLGLDPSEVRRVPSVYKIDKERARKTLDKLQEYGFPLGSVHLYPELLLMCPGPLENYVRIMRESGFAFIREEFLIKFRGVIKRTIPMLQKEAGMPKVINVVEQYCSELEMDEDFCDRFIDSLPRDTGRVTLFELRRQIIASYFSKLGLVPAKTMYETVLEKHPRLNYRSLNWIRRSYHLLKEFEFTDEKIRRHLYLLQGDPDNLAKLLEIPSLAGIDTKSLCHSRPRIAMSVVSTLLDIEKAFVDHGIPFESIQKYPGLFTLSSTTIRRRLEEIEKIPEFKLLKLHPRISRLLYYHTKASERLTEFRAMQVPVPSIHLLSQDKTRFNKAVSEGEVRTKGVDILVCLSKILQVPRSAIRQSITRHPHWIHIPLLSVKEGLNFLQSLHNFTKQQIVDALPLALYPTDKIEQGVEQVISSGEGKITDPYFLQLVMYFLERQCHFTGDGVWADKVVRHEDSEDTEPITDQDHDHHHYIDHEHEDFDHEDPRMNDDNAK